VTGPTPGQPQDGQAEGLLQGPVVPAPALSREVEGEEGHFEVTLAARLTFEAV
jgi:hypothetical protein